MPLRTALLILAAALVATPLLLVAVLLLLPPQAALLLGLAAYGVGQLVARWRWRIALAALVLLAWHVYRTNRSTDR
jgi:hypothetical protein